MDKKDCDSEQVDKEEHAAENLKKRLIKIREWLHENPTDKKGARKRLLKQSNVIDNESAKMPTAHGVVQGYTGVATVDGKNQVVVYAEAFGENQEKCLLKPAVEGVRENFSKTDICTDAFKGATLLADTGYHSDNNIEMLMDEGIDALYSRRMGIIEPVFGNIRNAIGLKRFTLRGKIKVGIQW